MLSPRAMPQGEEAAPVENGMGKAAHPESSGLSSARTQCSAPDLLLLAFGDDQGAAAHEKRWGPTAPPRDGNEPAPFHTALREAVPRRGPAPEGGGGLQCRRRRWPRSGASGPRPSGSRRPPPPGGRRAQPWELGSRQRRPCLGDESLAPTARRQWCQCARRRRKSARDVVRTRCAVPWVPLTRWVKYASVLAQGGVRPLGRLQGCLLAALLRIAYSSLFVAKPQSETLRASCLDADIGDTTGSPDSASRPSIGNEECDD
ncbi:unnamed protein product [Prorocentrum cordatum]|uniref:Uncharacterized protein n=1 Tax=Prorocentrum cordatum TaxID=2364126 RepID=A0ABN9X957_9DINO|nr:unnamed protein product [Polarella glacialis]